MAGRGSDGRGDGQRRRADQLGIRRGGGRRVRPVGFLGAARNDRRGGGGFRVGPQHDADGRPLEPVGLAQLVDQEAAVGVADRAVGWLVLMKKVGGRRAGLRGVVEADVAAGRAGGRRLPGDDLLEQLVQLAGGDAARRLIGDARGVAGIAVTPAPVTADVSSTGEYAMNPAPRAWRRSSCRSRRGRPGPSC